MRQVEFVIDGVERKLDTAHVAGYCNKGALAVGSIFDLAFSFARDYSLDPPVEVRLKEMPVKLEVVEITAYRKRLPELSEGVTGTIQLRGAGLENLKVGWKLLATG